MEGKIVNLSFVLSELAEWVCYTSWQRKWGKKIRELITPRPRLLIFCLVHTLASAAIIIFCVRDGINYLF